jgi:hypothetical protein
MNNKLRVIRLLIPWRLFFQSVSINVCYGPKQVFYLPSSRHSGLVPLVSFLIRPLCLVVPSWPRILHGFSDLSRCVSSFVYLFPAFYLSRLLLSLCFAPLVSSCPDVTPLLSQLAYFLSTCLIMSLRDGDFNIYCAWNRFPITDTWSTTIGLFILSWRMIIAVIYIDIAWLNIHWAVGFGTMLKFYT